jgi:hypothetical protein
VYGCLNACGMNDGFCLIIGVYNICLCVMRHCNLCVNVLFVYFIVLYMGCDFVLLCDVACIRIASVLVSVSVCLSVCVCVRLCVCASD